MPFSLRLFRLLAVAFVLTACVAGAAAAPLAAASDRPLTDQMLRQKLQAQLESYLRSRGMVERVSAASLSVVSLPGSPALNVTAGTKEIGGRGGRGGPITPTTLFQIGSNTKAFTAATILELEAEKKLSIDQTVGRWLPQYPAYRDVTIRRLLDMTSGIPTYDAVQSLLRAYAATPRRDFTIPVLVAYVAGMPPKTGYNYSNTNYLLAELIVEKCTGHRYADEIERRFFRPLGLMHTYYSGHLYPAAVLDRMSGGYFFSNTPDNAGLAAIYGKNVRTYSMSWARAAGAIVSTPEDLTKWVRALYGTLLPAKQKAELETLVSLKTGKPLAEVNPKEPRAFGLGVAKLCLASLCPVWFYEGETLGYRMVHIYVPKNHVTFALALNSQPNAKDDQIGKLVESIYATLQSAGQT